MQMRERIMRRDCSMCQTCKRNGRITLASEVDHITALDNGGSNDDDNLEAICVECHKAKSAKDTGKQRRPQIGPDGWPVADGYEAGAGRKSRSITPETAR